MYNDYAEMAWQKVREEALAFNEDIEKSLIKKWLNEINYTEPIGYFRNSWKREMEIYATRPGLLIGKAGAHINKLKIMLTEEFGGEWEIKLIEIRGGFVGI